MEYTRFLSKSNRLNALDIRHTIMPHQAETQHSFDALDIRHAIMPHQAETQHSVHLQFQGLDQGNT